MNWVFSLVALLGVVPFVSLPAVSQQNPCTDSCDSPTPWSDFNGFEMKMTIAGQSDNASWKGSFDPDSGDIQIDVETSERGEVKRGKILMVGGRMMAAQGPIIEPGYEIDALDAPVLELQLLMRLLGRALPNGPEGLEGVRKIDFKEEKRGIQIATPSAGGFIPPPWSLRGRVNVVTAEQVQYQLTLNAAMGGKLASDIDFSGQLSKIKNARIDDAMPLDRWDLFGVGVQTKKTDKGTIYDYATGPANASYKTVADVRRKIAKDDYPGELDSSKDFTGFWKEDCEQAFGFQIMHYGADGKYSMVFCGPGGCGNPSDSRITFITKDPHFEVVSENEIRERGTDGWSTYHRCTRDTHPILKYKDK